MALVRERLEREEKIRGISLFFQERLQEFLAPLPKLLDQHLYKRLVHTVALHTAAILRFRHRNHGLLLSGLGAYILSPDKEKGSPASLSDHKLKDNFC